ncbi:MULTISPECIES: hypothetical protein [Psychrobacter]|uniref:Uncharacterized protein n=1 Tax=Psychrobacter alimentarius TaxID=261164 RepID=A0ABM6A126_9GAMM|nr:MULTISPECIES: hypothetical protein [Psychrobacter]AMT98093.1 hypothetical protein A3K91_2522 [Psychrobacter alimentarius]QCB29639.1 hypothetical protein E5677_00795 [Psychrobacter sp. PAMC27889]
MDDTMSSYSFSQHFYQRWTCAPEPIRAAITQELEDITNLLQTETPFESFVFRTHDLDAHVDELYENHEAEQAIAKAIIDKQEKERAAAEQQRLEDEKSQAIAAAKQQEKDRRLETEATAQKELEKNALSKPVTDNNNPNASTAANAADKTSIDGKNIESTENNATGNTGKASADTDTKPQTIAEPANPTNEASIKTDIAIKAINTKASAAISLALKDTNANTNHQSLIRELEMQIDDYLSDQMMLMSENLKSWLRAEITQHLGDQGTPVKKEEDIKKNIH